MDRNDMRMFYTTINVAVLKIMSGKTKYLVQMLSDGDENVLWSRVSMEDDFLTVTHRQLRKFKEYNWAENCEAAAKKETSFEFLKHGKV